MWQWLQKTLWNSPEIFAPSTSSSRVSSGTVHVQLRGGPHAERATATTSYPDAAVAGEDRRVQRVVLEASNGGGRRLLLLLLLLGGVRRGHERRFHRLSWTVAAAVHVALAVLGVRGSLLGAPPLLAVRTPAPPGLRVHLLAEVGPIANCNETTHTQVGVNPSESMAMAGTVRIHVYVRTNTFCVGAYLEAGEQYRNGHFSNQTKEPKMKRVPSLLIQSDERINQIWNASFQSST